MYIDFEDFRSLGIGKGYKYVRVRRTTVRWFKFNVQQKFKVINNGFLREEIGSCLERFRCAGSDNWNEEISFLFGPNWVWHWHQQDDSEEGKKTKMSEFAKDLHDWWMFLEKHLNQFNLILTRAVSLKICETQPSSIHRLSSPIFPFVRPASVTSPLISTIWCSRPYKPYIFC